MKENEARVEAQQTRSMEDVKELIKRNQHDITAV